VAIKHYTKLLLDPSIHTICTSTIDSQASYKVSYLFVKPFRMKSILKKFYSFPSLLDSLELDIKVLDPLVPKVCTSTNGNEALYSVSSLSSKP
jgi:hypothetical protein